MAATGTEPLVVQAIYSFKGKNNDEVKKNTNLIIDLLIKLYCDFF